ncbi:hypothetical protein H0A66_07790 [Alcaligenaceae bacterium]|nr:hypothetical protein [Alcaligenaceae bacterium]
MLWPVRRVRWAGWLSLLLCAGGVSCLLFAGLLLAQGWLQLAPAAGIAVLAAVWGIWRSIKSRPLAGTLSLRDCGLWEVTLSGEKKNMRLTHAWPAFAWITLQFHDPNSSKQQELLELVVWRGSVSRPYWCALWAHVAGQLAMPGQVQYKESP